MIVRGNISALFGLISPVLGFAFISISIISSPWFSWDKNAISDLGHSLMSDVSIILNFGLLLTGLMLIIYAVLALRREAKWTGYCLILSGFALQLIATFDEVYGYPHQVVSILFFISLIIMSILYAFEGKSRLAASAFIVILVCWALFLVGGYHSGIAVPEVISSIAVSSWIMYSALKILKGE